MLGIYLHVILESGSQSSRWPQYCLALILLSWTGGWLILSLPPSPLSTLSLHAFVHPDLLTVHTILEPVLLYCSYIDPIISYAYILSYWAAGTSTCSREDTSGATLGGKRVQSKYCRGQDHTIGIASMILKKIPMAWIFFLMFQKQI